jgi:hypothetical protein
MAVHLFRQLLSHGTSAFTEAAYFGSEPLDGRGEWVDVMVTTQSAIETRWFFSRASGQLLGLDSRLYEDAEACSIRFENWQEFNGKRLPASWNVFSGDTPFATLKIEKAEFASKK